MKSDLVFRIIPCLDIKDGMVVKGVNFRDLRYIDSPIELAKKYNNEGADEIVFLDITASSENRDITIDMVKKVAKEVFIPFTVGGGINKLDDIYKLLNAGCDKVSINSSAVKKPSFIDESVKHFGSQCIVIAIDVKKQLYCNNKWSVFINGGKVDAGIDYTSWAKEVLDRGAGEILLTSMDRDGIKMGYDLDILSYSKFINVPLIASGGAGNMDDIKNAYLNGADAALAASIFHNDEINIASLKSYLSSNNVNVRM